MLLSKEEISALGQQLTDCVIKFYSARGYEANIAERIAVRVFMEDNAVSLAKSLE